MDLPNDFKELLELFNAKGVEYLVVGGYAVAFHGAPRYTGDIDLYVRPTPENARRILEALVAFGFGDVGLDARDFEVLDRVVQLGVPPVRIDLVTSIAGVSWEESWRAKVPGEYGGTRVFVIGREELLKNKRAAGRQKDLADIESLGETS